jgi:hypothetical protein
MKAYQVFMTRETGDNRVRDAKQTMEKRPRKNNGKTEVPQSRRNNKWLLRCVCLTLTAFALVFNACQKDGVYHPKKKISKIYTSYTGEWYNEPKTLQESWTWGKRNLEKIAYKYYTTTFSYNSKNQMIKADDNDGYRLEMTYKGSQISEVSEYEYNTLLAKYKYTHKNGKISKIILEYYGYDFEDYASVHAKTFQQKKMLNFPLPQPIANEVPQRVAKRAETGKHRKVEIYTMSYTFKWDGDNIVQYTVIDETDGYTYEIKCEYDKYLNPFHNHIYGDIEFEGELFCTSKNNIVKITYYEVGWTPEEDTYTYEYDGKYPTKQIYYGESSVYTTYYEYE